MSWIQKLYETYEQCESTMDVPAEKLWPLSHLVKRAHVEIIIDERGSFRRARTLGRTEASTLIPVTESSAGRTAGAAPHPLCEEISYCAADYPEISSERFEEYEQQLAKWCRSENTHPKISAILAYIRSKRLWKDLCNEQIFPITTEDAKGKKTKVSDSKVFVRWRVEYAGNPVSGTWEDSDLIMAWIAFDRSQNSKTGFCMITGEFTRLCQNHPRFLRGSDDGAKLISANDFNGYTFKGRFTDTKKDYEKQTCSVGYEVSLKAHNALRWLIGRQAYRSGDLVIVTWSIAGKPVPDPFKDSLSLILGIEGSAHEAAEIEQPDVGDIGQAFAIRLRKAIAGYSAKLNPTDDIVVMGLDSATPGRMAITFYRELKSSDFLNRVKNWHEQYAWPQNFGKDSKFIGAPAPRDIAEAAYGRRLDDSLRKATVERMLPCIIDGQALPRDLVESVIRRTSNRVSFEKDKNGRQWEWEKILGIACALFKGSCKKRGYQMVLENDRTSRDYLYGRLLSIAEHIEDRALYVSGEKRDTTAAKLMQRFADRPNSTWRTIELALTPYRTRLRAKSPAFLHNMEMLLDEVVANFERDEFVSDRKLSGEFLLGYHCQRLLLNLPKQDKTDGSASDNDSINNDN
ncbi:type I-C CRISPR-associated protein Cas8c/Csd1 [Nitrosomonas halophila]|uniref:CRISPR-associated protein Csd1 n=1 Tax=Nitrosomonas halophila TaxID=44576 RepID=A0A1H3DKH5_9PROT|nr:type I-C CRISPR-associated protein Cas8c/Csd1 [Nitrosomonas halophila]SDX66139.1 CRISPR-associated protein Csd1 [Nitrosomonas halophila]